MGGMGREVSGSVQLVQTQGVQVAPLNFSHFLVYSLTGRREITRNQKPELFWPPSRTVLEGSFGVPILPDQFLAIVFTHSNLYKKCKGSGLAKAIQKKSSKVEELTLSEDKTYCKISKRIRILELQVFYSLNVCVLVAFSILKPDSKCDGLYKWGLQRWLGHGRRAFMDRNDAYLTKEILK